jgi:hypothetical protein
LNTVDLIQNVFEGSDETIDCEKVSCSIVGGFSFLYRQNPLRSTGPLPQEYLLRRAMTGRTQKSLLLLQASERFVFVVYVTQH